MSAPLITETMKRLGKSMSGVLEKRVFSKITRKVFKKDFWEDKIQDMTVSEFQELLREEFKKEGIDIEQALAAAMSETKESLGEIKNDIAGLWARTDANLVEILGDDPVAVQNLTLMRLELAETFARLKEDNKAIAGYLGRVRFELSSINMVVSYQHYKTRQAIEQRLNEILHVLSLICKKLDIEITIPETPLLEGEGSKIELLDDRSRRLINEAISELNGVIRPATPLPLRELREKMSNRDLDTLLKTASILFREGDYIRALTVFTQMVNLDPANSRAKFYRAVSLRAIGELDSAAEEFKDLLDDPEVQIEALTSLADTYLKQDRIEEALALVATVRSDRPEVLFTKALVALSAGFYKDSIALYKKLLKTREHYQPFDVFTNIGVAYSKLEKDKKAVIYFKKALDLAQESEERSEAHFNLGYAYYRLNHVREARKHFNEAVKYDPKSAKAHLNLGFCQQNYKKHDKAVYFFNKAITLDPSLQSAWYRSAISYEYLGEKKRAMKYFKKAAMLQH
ncbi:MAG: tetratricopeptide repeat protein [Candidatus Odinarchaeota archaeon]